MVGGLHLTNLVRDNLLNGNCDASHLVLGLPLTMSLGVGSPKSKTYTSIVQNINGNARAMHIKRKDKRDPKARMGLRAHPPPDSVANMSAGNLNGMFFAEPWWKASG